jgi:hypothetical protein
MTITCAAELPVTAVLFVFPASGVVCIAGDGRRFREGRHTSEQEQPKTG